VIYLNIHYKEDPLHRSRVVAVAVFLVILGTILPLTAMIYFSWILARSEELDKMHLFAHQAIVRAHLAIQESTNVLITASKLHEYPPCSEGHIEEMRHFTLNTRSIEEMGYFENNLLKCTSWGLTTIKIVQLKPDFIDAKGIGFTVRMQPLVVSKSKPMTALEYKSYNVLINPDRFADVIVDPHVQIAIATDSGHLLSTLNSPNLDLLNKIIFHPINGVDKNDLIASENELGLIGIVIEPREFVLKKLYKQLMLLLPVGALISAGMIVLIIWVSRRRLSLLGELTVAVENHEFIVYYQPIVELTSGICKGAEALVRWRRLDGSFVIPDFFIPIAEESGLIKPITDQVISLVISDLKNLLLVNRNLHIAINLCADDIKTGRIIPILQAKLKNTSIQYQQIWLEATERGFMDIEAARATITRARELGFSVAIDDFGTGYSSLSYLQGFPLDALKIDKSFVDTIGTDSATSSVTPHIINMAKTFDLKIIAEGVETKAQADYLMEHKVEYGQGWLFGKPMPADKFIAYCLSNAKLKHLVR
jgi:sensor c-di-GMP phosphodiesterase-like protein